MKVDIDKESFIKACIKGLNDKIYEIHFVSKKWLYLRSLINKVNLFQYQSYLDEALNNTKTHTVRKIHYVHMDNHIYEMADILQRDTVYD